jgi:hypothetical protein
MFELPEPVLRLGQVCGVRGNEPLRLGDRVAPPLLIFKLVQSCRQIGLMTPS